MKTLILVRHANALSAWEARVNTDAQRPLSDEGRAKARQTADEIARLGFTPDVILTSPLTRAVQTAEILAGTLRAPLSRETFLNGFQTETDVRECLTEQMENHSCLLAVGHNPNVSVLAQRMTRTLRRFQPGSFIVLNMDDPQQPICVHFGE